MINLKNAIYYEYVDDVIIEIFDKYKWGLKRLEVEFSQELLETIVYCSFNLEGALIAFCAWTLWKKESGERFSSDKLTTILIDALKQGWIPTEFQENYLKQHADILENPRNLIWRKAAEILGDDLRNQTISDITEDGKLIFRDNLSLTQSDSEKMNIFGEYIIKLWHDNKFFSSDNYQSSSF